MCKHYVCVPAKETFPSPGWEEKERCNCSLNRYLSVCWWKGVSNISQVNKADEL